MLQRIKEHYHVASEQLTHRAYGGHVLYVLYTGLYKLMKGEMIYPHGMICASLVRNSGVILTMVLWIDLHPYGFPIFIPWNSDQVDFSIMSTPEKQIRQVLFPLGKNKARTSLENLCKNNNLSLTTKGEGARKLEMVGRREVQSFLATCQWEHKGLELSQPQVEEQLRADEYQDLVALLALENINAIDVIRSTVDRVRQEVNSKHILRSLSLTSSHRLKRAKRVETDERADGQ